MTKLKPFFIEGFSDAEARDIIERCRLSLVPFFLPFGYDNPAITQILTEYFEEYLESCVGWDEP